MKKTDIAIICSTVISVLAMIAIGVLIWFFNEEVMKFLKKAREILEKKLGKYCCWKTEAEIDEEKEGIIEDIIDYGKKREKAWREIGGDCGRMAVQANSLIVLIQRWIDQENSKKAKSEVTDVLDDDLNVMTEYNEKMRVDVNKLFNMSKKLVDQEHRNANQYYKECYEEYYEITGSIQNNLRTMSNIMKKGIDIEGGSGVDNECDCPGDFKELKQEAIEIWNDGCNRVQSRLLNLKNAFRDPSSIPEPEIAVDQKELDRLFEVYSNNRDEGMKQMHEYVKDRDNKLERLKKNGIAR
jgi:hypothetical protein